MFQKSNNTELDIALELIREPKHIRGLAQSLQLPPSTVMRKINSMLSRNLVGYERQGKNKRFFLKRNLQARNCVFMAELHKLSNLMRAYPDMAIILQDVLSKSSAGVIIVFGSYAKFRANSGSDIDIYMDAVSDAEKRQIAIISRKISIKAGMIDMKSFLVKEIVRDHVILRGMERFYEETGFFAEAAR